jgi:Ceramidase
MRPDPVFLMAYCERIGNPAFWAEPLNAITNFAFVLAALSAFLVWRRVEPRDPWILGLIGLTLAIAMGSFLFHTIPNRLTVSLDVLPIQLFILLYFGLALRRFLAAPLWLTLTGPVVFFIVSNALVGLIGLAGRTPLGVGIGFLPALLALIAFGIALGVKQSDNARRTGRALLIASLLFALSLTFRTLDRPLCGFWPFGLHFMWHVLNACVLGLLMMAMARHRAWCAKV